jgi:hypothetical protein
MAKKSFPIDPGDIVHNIFKTAWEAPDTVAKAMFIGLANINDTFNQPLYKNRRSRYLPSLLRSGASLETMNKWWRGDYNKRNTGGR